MADTLPIKSLNLPGRFEKLETESQATSSDLAGIIERVDSACTEIETVLQEIKSGGIGRLQVLHGHSGAGKTTFLHGLQYFFQNIDIVKIPRAKPLEEIAAFIRQDSLHRNEHRLYIIHDRDNPTDTDTQLRVTFENLRSLFRTEDGRVLVVWPITDAEKAANVADIAWAIGRDSLLGIRGRVYSFNGLPRDRFTRVADTTTRALNAGENLEAFGVGSSVATELARQSETIGEFFSRLNAKSAERNDSVLKLLKARTRPHVWVVVPGDDLKELDRTISSLTQGTRNRLDIDKIAEFLDNEDNKSAYLTDWRSRRADMAYLMRILDVRLFEFPPNAALAAIRCYAADTTKTGLQKKNESADNCADTINGTRLGQALLDPDAQLQLRVRETSEGTGREFVAVQQLAAKSDKALNKAVALALRDFLQRNKRSVNVVSEKQAVPGSQLFPDIQLPEVDGSIICLEFTWRSTGKNLSTSSGDRKPQNTLTAGHIMKYLLEKVMEYVKDLKL